MFRWAQPGVASLVLLVGCSSAPDTAPDAGAPDAGPVGGDRPADVFVPSSYRAGTPAPLVVMLHGYSVTGDIEELYLGLEPLAESRGFLYVHPTGTVDASGNYFWNATDACCNFSGSQVDDSSYLLALVAEISGRYSVDPRRVYFVGHSNGGFMSYRMACDHADVVAAVGSLAGATWLDTAKCAASEPVAVLQIHGTADTEVVYDGVAGSYPSAKVTVADWAAIDGCSAELDTSPPPVDLVDTLPGAETTVARHDGCKPGGAAELWSLQGAGHIPSLGPAFSPALVDFLLAHPKE